MGYLKDDAIGTSCWNVSCYKMVPTDILPISILKAQTANEIKFINWKFKNKL